MTTKAVYAYRKNPATGKNYYTEIGVGFPNEDGSMGLKFNLVPADPELKLIVRDRFERKAASDEAAAAELT